MLLLHNNRIICTILVRCCFCLFSWVIAKIDLQDIWLIDYFGGATILDPKEYFSASVGSAGSTTKSVEITN